jgi:hypothetical protein
MDDLGHVGLEQACPARIDLASHVESHYSAETGVWTAPKLVASPYLQVHGLSPGSDYVKLRMKIPVCC